VPNVKRTASQGAKTRTIYLHLQLRWDVESESTKTLVLNQI